MASLDVIRKLQIQGSAPGVDDATASLNRLKDAIAAANDNLTKSNAVAQGSSDGFRITGEGAALAANHLRQAAEAAYVLSPAFRGVVNEMSVPALAAANTALAAVAAGIVTATNYAGSGLIAVAVAAEKASPSLLAYTTDVRSAGIAMEAFSPSVTGAAGSLLSFLSPALRLVGWFTLAVKGIEDVGEAWRLGGQKLGEYVALSEKATAAGTSTDFFQSITKAATDAKLPVDALTAALKKLRDQTSDQLGGTTGQNHLNDLISYGNFGGNSGVGQFANANTTEDKLKAISNLIDQAMQKGERLAALDVAKTFLGDAVASNLAKDSDYLNKMVIAADKVKGDDLVSQASIDNAVALQNRLDAAEKILSERWHPIQDILVKGGIAMREAWVGIVEQIAKAADWAAKLAIKLADAPLWFVQKLNEGATAFMNARTTPESRKAAEDAYGISSNPADIAMTAARQKLASGFQNPANVADATDQINAIQNKVFGDLSHPKPPPPPDTSGYDRAIDSLHKYIETTDAASKSVDAGVYEQERLKAIAELTAAGMKDGLSRAAATAKAELSGLANEAADAALKLEKAKIASEIKFGSNTSLLSQQDVAIAMQLKGIYPDVATALGSVEAHGIRVNNAFKEIGSAIETNLTAGLNDIMSGAKNAGQAFTDMGKAIVTAIEQMIIKIAIVQPLMQALQNSIGGNGGIFGGLFGSAAASPAAAFAGGTAAMHAGGIVGSEATFSRYVHPSYFDDAPRFHSGGIAGDEVPIIARKGEGVFTPGQMAAMGGGGGTQVNVNVMNFGNDNVSVNQKQNGNGGIDLEVMIGQAAASQMAKKGSALRQVTDNRALLASR